MKISLIMPVYNVERYLCEAIDSVISQTFSDWELICVDDGSTDSSGRILDEYANKDSRVRVIHQVNSKVHAARNRGLEMVTGDWVGFVDPDDVIARNWLAVVSQYIRSGKYDFIRLRSQKGTEVPVNFINLPFSGSSQDIPKDIMPRWGWSTLSSAGFLWLCFIKRECIGDLRFRPDINCKEDGIFLLELLPKLKVGVQVDYKGYFYRTVQGSLSIRPHQAIQTVAFIAAYCDIWSQQHAWASENAILDCVRNQLASGAAADITDWALRRQRMDQTPVSDIRKQYIRLRELGAIPKKYRCKRSRYRVAFRFWEVTGIVWPMTLIGRLFLKSGNILRRFGLR